MAVINFLHFITSELYQLLLVSLFLFIINCFFISNLCFHFNAELEKAFRLFFLTVESWIFGLSSVPVLYKNLQFSATLLTLLCLCGNYITFFPFLLYTKFATGFNSCPYRIISYGQIASGLEWLLRRCYFYTLRITWLVALVPVTHLQCWQGHQLRVSSPSTSKTDLLSSCHRILLKKALPKDCL